MKTTKKLSPRQLERLDYLLYQFKRRGIYIDMNLLVRRPFTTADGLNETSKFKGAAKPVSLFDPKLIELQKEYAKDLFTHYNPYTGLCYCNDPAIALIEITNENSMMFLKNMALPEYYQNKIDELWAEWRAENKNATKDDFYLYVETNYINELVGFLKKELGIKVPITGIGGYQHLEDIIAQASCDFLDKHVYWDHPKFSKRRWGRNNFGIHSKSMLSDSARGIVGDIKAAKSLSDKPLTISEWSHCYPNRYAYETPLLIAAEAAISGVDGLFQFAFSHGWNKKPNLDSISNYFDAISNPQLLILCSLGSLLLYKAGGIQYSVENGVFRLDHPIIKGTSGAIKGKNIVFDSFSITAGENGAVFLYSYSCLEKPINESGRLILVAIGEIKNTDAGWENGKFKWGKPPVLLKRIPATMRLSSKNNFTVYALNNKGRRCGKIRTVFRDGAVTFKTGGVDTPWFEVVFSTSSR